MDIDNEQETKICQFENQGMFQQCGPIGVHIQNARPTSVLRYFICRNEIVECQAPFLGCFGRRFVSY